MTEAQAPPKRARWLGPRYSLGFLFFAITACGIGLAAWFRPYQEEQFGYYEGLDGTPDLDRPHSRHVQTWRRQWGGHRLLHGPSQSYHFGDDTPWLTQTFHLGQRHGPETFRDIDGFTYVSQFVHDKQHGVATVHGPDGAFNYSTTWSNGRLHGDAEHRLPGGRVRRYRFAQGVVTHCDGEPINSALLEKLARGQVDEDTADLLDDTNDYLRISIGKWEDARLLSQVDNTDWSGKVQSQPWERMEVLGKADIVDTFATERWQEPPFFPLGIKAASALVLMARATNCQCDYRDGCVWVSPGLDDPNWRDPTGVAVIRPPPGSPLASVWGTEVDLDEHFRERPLIECLCEITQGLGINVDDSHIEEVSHDRNRNKTIGLFDYVLPFRHALTKLLIHARCRCELRGETLVILPQEAK